MMFEEVFVPFLKVTVNCLHSICNRFVVAIVDDCPCHTAEDRLNDIQELS